LEEVNFTVVAIPLNEITESMLGEETVCFDIVGVDQKTLLDVVLFIVDTPVDIVISSPKPGVIDYNILVVDLNHAVCSDLIIT
jgi:hypothetical protein